MDSEHYGKENIMTQPGKGDNSMQKITPHLWFDTEAQEAARFYTSVFPESRIRDMTVLTGTPSGSVDVITAELSGQEFTLISAGPLFKFNPSVSFHVRCASADEVDAVWKKLSDGGTVRMELGSYPFSKRYGWVADRYGVNWQVIATENPITQKFVPVLMFTDSVAGRTEEAIGFYVSVFRDANIITLNRYGKGEEPDKEGTIRYGAFMLENREFGAMDSARVHGAPFNEAVSFVVHCKDQEEIDYYWNKLSAVPEAEQCGWLKDKFGVSWQIVPTVLDEMIKSRDGKKIWRVTEVFLRMKKFDIRSLKKAYEGA